MSGRTETERLADMIAAGERATRHLGSLDLEGLLVDELPQDGIVRALDVMGEACKHISPTTRTRYPAVPWRIISRTRDRLIHGYDTVEWQIVWDTVVRHVPQALSELRRLLAELDAENPPPAEEPQS